jgi:hypothetical protein
MENKPDQTPSSDLEHKCKFKRSVWWKIYFFIFTFLAAIGLASVLTAPNAGASEYVGLVISLVFTVGLFGFVFLKPIHKPNFWLQVLIVDVVFSVIYYFITDVDLRMGMSDMVFYVSHAIGLVISFPGYYGLYAFSKSNNPIWSNA